MRRRHFLKSAGCFVATASMGGVLGCGDDDDRAARGDAGPDDAGHAAPGRYTFPHGVASGDPRPDSVMLWTRAAAEHAGAARIALKLEVATDTAFKQRVVAQDVEASADADYTVRVLVEGLEADTVYYYRFIAGADASRHGRTWTAPKPSADVPIYFAWVSCQDYKAGFYGAYRRLLNDDAAAAEAKQLRFVLHVGDFVYETRSAAFQSALDEDLMRIELKNPDGKPREVPAFPSGGGKRGDTEFAQTVDDYRHLYKAFLDDADLQDARAQWPFVNVWDDHEFSDDCWQTQTNYTDEKSFDEPSQQRRVAASQAWFEYTPAILSDGESADGVTTPPRTSSRSAWRTWRTAIQSSSTSPTTRRRSARSRSIAGCASASTSISCSPTTARTAAITRCPRTSPSATSSRFIRAPDCRSKRSTRSTRGRPPTVATRRSSPAAT